MLYSDGQVPSSWWEAADQGGDKEVAQQNQPASEDIAADQALLQQAVSDQQAQLWEAAGAAMRKASEEQAKVCDLHGATLDPFLNMLLFPGI